jgi:hypothetical protein
MKVNIHNQCSDLELTFRGHFNSGTQCDEDPDEEVDAGSMKSSVWRYFNVCIGKETC